MLIDIWGEQLRRCWVIWTASGGRLISSIVIALPALLVFASFGKSSSILTALLISYWSSSNGNGDPLEPKIIFPRIRFVQRPPHGLRNSLLFYLTRRPHAPHHPHYRPSPLLPPARKEIPSMGTYIGVLFFVDYPNRERSAQFYICTRFCYNIRNRSLAESSLLGRGFIRAGKLMPPVQKYR